jgi:hypothetical protein
MRCWQTQMIREYGVSLVHLPHPTAGLPPSKTHGRILDNKT